MPVPRCVVPVLSASAIEVVEASRLPEPTIPVPSKLGAPG
jgi:hypothetical protein